MLPIDVRIVTQRSGLLAESQDRRKSVSVNLERMSGTLPRSKSGSLEGSRAHWLNVRIVTASVRIVTKDVRIVTDKVRIVSHRR